MFVLKQDKDQGRFVTNLRNTVHILKVSCKDVPKTAYSERKNQNEKENKRTIIFPNIYSSQRFFLDSEPATEEEEVILLEEPVSLSF